MAANRTVILIVCAIMGMSTLATPVKAQTAPTVEDLATQNASNLMKAAQLQGAKLDAETRKEQSAAGTTAPADGDVISAPTVSTSAASNEQQPTVQGVFGANGNVIARVLMPDGGMIPVHVGSTLPGGGKVVRITADEVLVRDHGHVRPLSFSDQAPVVHGNTPTAPTSALTVPQFVPPGVPPVGTANTEQ